MLIQIPVIIIFDAASIHNLGASAGQRAFTVRYDTEDTDRHAEWCNYYPSRPDTHWIVDEQGVFFDLLTSAADKAITRRAEQNNASYQVEEK